VIRDELFFSLPLQSYSVTTYSQQLNNNIEKKNNRTEIASSRCEQLTCVSRKTLQILNVSLLMKLLPKVFQLYLSQILDYDA